MTGRDVALRPTKLICTIGPASVARVGELIAAGMDVARVNWSHGTAATHADAVRAVRAGAAAAGRPIPILADLPGPKIRLGPLAGDEVTLQAGASFELRPDPEPAGGPTGAGVSYARLGDDVRSGDHIFLADGAVELVVTAAGATVRTEVLRGGTVRSRQGVSIPSDRLSMASVTDADRRHIPAMLELGVDLVGQSFVRSADDLHVLRALLGPQGPAIVAKIETRAAVDRFDAILDVADAVMIARGDLGVEIPFEDVPLIQKDLVRRAAARAVPCIVATQMLESMTTAPRPTRAEASDVANAVLDGADAIMLSGETAIGAHPVLAASAATRIAERSAGHDARVRRDGPATVAPGGGRIPAGDADDTDALAAAAVELARSGTGVVAIVCRTWSGRTARLLAAGRPGVPILAVAPMPRVRAALTLVHGVLPDEGRGIVGFDHAGEAAVPTAAGGAAVGDPDADLELLVSQALDAGGPGAGVVVVASATDGPTAGLGHRLELRRSGV